MFKTLRSVYDSRIVLGLLIIAFPKILIWVIAWLYGHTQPGYMVPVWSDELSLWHEVLSFSHKGLNFGYYTINELVPSYLSFGTHGFGTVSVYALFAKQFGWETSSIIIANVFFLQIAYFFFLLLVLPTTTKQLIYILLFSVSFIPLILFFSTSMSELLNYSVILVYFGLLYRYFKQGWKLLFVALAVFCVWISFIRIIYIVLFLPVLFKRKTEFQLDKKFFFHLLLWLISGVILFVLNNLFVSPYPDSFLNELFSSVGIGQFISNFAVHFFQNTVNFINPVFENLIQVLERYFTIFIMIYSLLKSNILHLKRKKIEFDFFIVFLILILFVVINIAAYDVFDWRDYRVLAPVLFGCILFLIINGKHFISNSTLIINVCVVIVLIFSPSVVESFKEERFTKPIVNKILSEIKYENNAISKFDNTIVVNHFTASVLLNIPAGIGVTYCENISDKLKSRFVFSDKEIKLSTYKLINSNKSGYLYQKDVDNRTKSQDPNL